MVLDTIIVTSVPEQIERFLGTTIESYCASIYAKRPQWATQGSLSFEGAKFLFRSVLHARVSTVIEIGTATGLSASLQCYALDLASRAGSIDSNFRVLSYDISSFWHRDQSKRVGAAAQEFLPPALLPHLEFRNPVKAAEVKRDFGRDQIGFLFIDGNHQHPWPTLDLLAVLDCLREGAMVVFDDINLPLLLPEYQDWGAKYLFDSLNLEKELVNEAIPCMGSIRVPSDKESLRATLLEVLFRYPWQASIDEQYLSQLGVETNARRE